jgi:hypothetical protein
MGYHNVVQICTDNAAAMANVGCTVQRGRMRGGEWGSRLNEVTFEGYFEGTNADQLRGMPPVHPNQESLRLTSKKLFNALDQACMISRTMERCLNG